MDNTPTSQGPSHTSERVKLTEDERRMMELARDGIAEENSNYYYR